MIGCKHQPQKRFAVALDIVIACRFASNRMELSMVNPFGLVGGFVVDVVAESNAVKR